MLDPRNLLGDGGGFSIPGMGLGEWGKKPWGGQEGAPTRGQAIGGMLMGAAQGIGQGGTIASGIMGAAQGMQAKQAQAKQEKEREMWEMLQKLLQQRGMQGGTAGPSPAPMAPGPPMGSVY